MKKKWIKILATLFACATLALGFTACGDKENSSSDSSSGGDVSTEQSSSDSSSDSFDNNSGDNSSEQTHTHNYMAVTTAPTCTAQGFTTYTCACGDDYITDYVNALEHDFTNYISDNNATYEKDGTKTATCNRNGCEETDTVTDTGTKLQSGISFKTLSVDGTDVYGKVSYATETFSFINEVTAVGTAKYVVSLDIYGAQQVATKTIPLTVGDNKVYITEMVDDEPINVYTVIVRRRPMYDVTFNANGGTSVQTQTIEEDFCASQPTSTRTGYTFKAWNYDFATPITKNTEITASWTANENTPYKVEYYLQNLEDDNYTLKETVNKTGTTDTTANAEIKAFTHFTHTETATDSGNISPDGSTVLKVYYTRDSYDIVVNGNNVKAGTSTEIDENYRYDEGIIAIATTNVGYTWLGWYAGETLVCTTQEFAFKVEKGITYTATWKANEDTKYTVNYYWQNIDDDTYTLHEYAELMGMTDTTAMAVVNEYEHFTYNESMSTVSGNIDGDNSLVLNVYYTRNAYVLSMNKSDGSSINKGNYKYGKEITTTVTLQLGYEFLGWYSGETLLSTDLTCTLTMEQDVTVTAIFVVKAEMLNFNFTSTETTCIITGVKNATVTEIVIPDYVTSIGDSAFENCTNLANVYITSIEKWCNISFGNEYANPFCYAENLYLNNQLVTELVIPNGVTSIGAYAFYNCDNLTSLIISSSVTTIYSYAFGSCDNLTSVLIGNGVTNIYAYTFYGCSSLAEMTLPFVGAHKDATGSLSVFGFIFGYRRCSSSDAISGATYQYCESVEYYHYYIPISLKKVTITGGVIGDYAFRNCSSLTSIELPDGVTRIGAHTFAGCSSLASIELPDSVTSIGWSAFSWCSSLRNLAIPNSVTNIGDGAFSHCSSLTAIELSDSITSIESNAFSCCNSLMGVRIPDSVTFIGHGAFYHCSSLTSMDIPDSVGFIEYEAFAGCSSLTSIELPDGITSISSYTFAGCSSLTSIEIPDSVTGIVCYAFYCCDSLTSITFEDASTWYRTLYSTEYNKKTGGRQTSLADSMSNATYFKSTYYNYSWYKL